MTLQPAPSSLKIHLKIQMFGGFTVALNGAPMPKMHSRQDAWALALLILQRGDEVDRITLAQTLWPLDEGYLESKANDYLRKSLWQLRKALGEQASRLLSPTNRTLRIELSGADVDLIEFERLIARGDTVSLQAAIALYRGPLLAGCNEHWVHLEREAKQQNYIQALLELSARTAAAGDYQQTVNYLRKARVTDPYWEPTRRALMETLARCGLLSEALREYQDLRDLLHRERHGEPATETTVLYELLRAKKPNAATVAPSQSIATRLPPLPQPLTSLIGREEALREIQARLQLTRLMTLMGAGGIGKTRLALAVAQEVREEFPQGVWFVELAALQAADHVARAVAQTLNVREEPQQSLTQTLARYLAERSLLLVLDNCEHLLDSCAELAVTLLSSCPRLRILATSRQPLGILGETAWRVPSLPVPNPKQILAEGNELQAQVGSYAAVQLFTDRAAAQGAFQLTPDNARAVAEICHLLDGVPLAIELAAARIRLLSPTQIVQGLDDRFRILTGGGRAVLARHQTLWALIDWSYTLLAPDEQRLLRHLAVFRGGFTLEAVEAVAKSKDENGSMAGKEDPAFLFPLPSSLFLDLLTSLIDQSLISIEYDAGGEPRYSLSETIRQFAHYQLLSSDEYESVGRRHRDYFLALAESAEPGLRNASQPLWLDRLEKEHDNLRAALDYTSVTALEEAALEVTTIEEVTLEQRTAMKEGDAETRLRLAASLWHFWAIRSYIAEGRQRLIYALEQAPASSPFRAAALVAAGVLTDYDGRPEEAIPLLTAGLDLAGQRGDRWLVGHATIMLGWVHRMIDPECAANLLQAAAALAREVGDRWLRIEALSTGGFFALYHGDVKQARLLFEEGLPLCRELGDPWLMSEMVCHLGLVYRLECEYEVAEMLFVESIQLSRELGDRRGMCSTLCYLGDTLLHCGKRDLAIRHLLEGLALSKEVNYGRGIAAALEALALDAQMEQRSARAARLLGATEALRVSMNAPIARIWRPAYDRLREQVRAAMDEARFTVCFGQGQRMSLQQVMQYAQDSAAD